MRDKTAIKRTADFTWDVGWQGEGGKKLVGAGRLYFE
jgi:hypothetical protein